MKNLGYIASEITKGKNLSDNLVKYGKGLSSLYNGLAYIKMSMNYYTILNMIKDNEIDDELFLEMFQGVNEIIEISSIDSAVASEDVLTDKISSLRNRLIAIMESITDYVDKFKIYEYVLNRVEYRFKDDELDEEYYNTYMTNDIMHYILSDKDNVSINGRISEMVGQLPIRMSKARFYDHIKDAFTLYHGAQKQTIDDFYYSLSTSAMLKDADKDSMFFKDMNDFYVTLKNADYKNLDSSEYTRLRGVTAKWLKRKYPAMPKVLLERAKHYNETVCFCHRLAENKPQDTVLLQPEKSLNSFEKDVKKLDEFPLL